MNLNNMMVNMMMGQLRQKNPQAYSQLQNYMNSGKSPEQVLNELLASGQFTQEDVNRAQQMMSQYQNGSNNSGGNFTRF